MIAKKCDRCGKFYEYVKNYGAVIFAVGRELRIKSLNEDILNEVFKEDPDHTNNKGERYFDFCGNCLLEFKEFMLIKSKNE